MNMKNFILFFFLIYSCMSAIAYTTEASKFAEEQYGLFNNNKVHINSKKEHTVEYQQFIGDIFVPAITYGYGDMKISKKQKKQLNKEKYKGSKYSWTHCLCNSAKNKKCRITYTVLLDCNCKPIWSGIYPSK